MKKVGTILLGILALSVCYSAVAKLSLHNTFIGISGELLKNVKTRLDLEQQAITQAKPLTIATILKINKNAPNEINKALQPYGYFQAQIHSKLENRGDRWDVTYYIKLGKPLRITKLEVKLYGAAARDPRFIRLLQRFPLRQGDIFTVQRYNLAKEKLFHLASARGYLHAKMQQAVVQVSIENYTANITIRFDSGSRYSFGSAIFAKTKFDPDFLGKFLDFAPGELYSSTKIRNTQQNFHDSNIFGNVIVEPQLKNIKNRQVPISVHIIPRKNLEYNIGAGYGTDTKLRGSLGLQLNNIGPIGQRLTGHVQASWDRGSSFEMRYLIPGNNPITSQYDISAGFESQYNEYGDTDLVKAGSGYTTIVHGWQQILRLNVVAENWQFDSGNQSVDDRKHRALLLVPTVSWLKSKANNPIRPTKGYRISATIQGVPHSMLSSSVSFIQTELDAKFMYPIPRGPILVLRGSVGYTAIISDHLDELPMSFWFSAGGSQSVRGYRYQNIGPGIDLVTGSIELRQRMHGNWYMAVFVDTGNAANHIGTTIENFHNGAGIGVVWLSPIGAIQLSFARPVGEKGLGEAGMIQFSMGPEL